MQHRNAPLTPNGRRRLVALVEEEGLTFEAAAAASNVAKSTGRSGSRAGGRRATSRGADPGLPCRTAPRAPTAAREMLSDEDHERCCEVRQRTGWGPRLDRLGGGHPPRDRASGAAPPWLLAPPSAPAAAVRPLRVALPGQPAAHGHQAPRALPGARPRGDRQAHRSARAEPAGSSCTPSSTTALASPTQRSTTTSGPRPSPPSPAGRLDWFLERGIVTERLLTDNAWVYVQEQGPAGAAGRPSDRALAHQALLAADQREGGAPAADDGPRVGPGAQLRSSADRRAALPHWLDHYNESRRHSALGNRPPMARVRDVLGHDI